MEAEKYLKETGVKKVSDMLKLLVRNHSTIIMYDL